MTVGKSSTASSFQNDRNEVSHILFRNKDTRSHQYIQPQPRIQRVYLLL